MAIERDVFGSCVEGINVSGEVEKEVSNFAVG